MIDLRSDTVTQPTADMRAAMFSAPLGDDVLGDDPSVQTLESHVAELLGKPAAVFMPSGTMTNQVAVRSHCQPGDEIFLEAEAHIFYYEGGGPAALSGASCRLIPGKSGVFTASDVAAAIRPGDPHFANPRLVCIENTHNRSGGRIFPLSEIHHIAQLCAEHQLGLHMDGARLWNACVASGVSPADYAEPFDTVSVCFSKGLGAPVGSALVGEPDLIQRARRFRKMFGGGMRQSGMLAAAAQYALEHHIDRLAEDHQHARQLAEGLADVPGISVDISAIETNMVNFEVPGRSASALVQDLAAVEVAMLATGPQRIRAVTHLMVTGDDIEKTINAIASCV